MLTIYILYSNKVTLNNHAKRLGAEVLFYISKFAETIMLCLLVSLSSITAISFFDIL